MPKVKLIVIGNHKQTWAHHGVTTPNLYLLHLVEGSASKDAIETLSPWVLILWPDSSPEHKGFHPQEDIVDNRG